MSEVADDNSDDELSIRGEYEKHGADGYYQQFGSDYRNPHEPIIRRSLKRAVERWPLDLSNVLDLAAGSGEVTLALRELGAAHITGIDPYTTEAYLRRTGDTAEKLTFAEISGGALMGRRFSLIVASFALHLVEQSRLAGLLWQLGQVSSALLVITPHKRPIIRGEWGWELKGEAVVERVRSRFYRAGP